MAKKEIKERKLITGLSSLKNINANYNPDFQPKTEEKTYQFNFKTNKNWVYRFYTAQMKFLQYNVDFKKFGALKSFFKMILMEFTQELKNKNEYHKATENFIFQVTKKGRRIEQGDRFVKASDRKSIVFGEYPQGDETQELLYNLMFSLAEKEKYANLPQYTISYFFYDILQYTEENLERLAAKNESK